MEIVGEHDGGGTAVVLLSQALAIAVVIAQHHAVYVVDAVVEPAEDIGERVGDTYRPCRAKVLRTERLHETREPSDGVGRERKLLRRTDRLLQVRSGNRGVLRRPLVGGEEMELIANDR